MLQIILTRSCLGMEKIRLSGEYKFIKRRIPLILRLRHLYVMLLLLYPPALLQAQENETLVTVDGSVITRQEFESRYALSIYPLKDVERLVPVIKRQFLYSLIAEKLLAAEARRLGYDSEHLIGRSARLAEEMFVRD